MTTRIDRRFADLRASELPGKVSDRSTLILPLGAIEQHGPHLPYSTDLLVAEAAGVPLLAMSAWFTS